ncbi:hypothetical protein BCF59_0516 [Mycoplasmopsis mustelae]|uniref:Endonuclease n=1 Tax=Mycoplasmopsis mustelae TaxID=171289 RepID=A0A4R7UC72_9BACT|nr:hypothetical protein [Mycoplasmopsis mustelae]TDV23527.1 hypothetical protein BCF59_0516 [Mycoplasmopsis mustelae]
MLEKQLQNKVKRILNKHRISYIKIAGGEFQRSGIADLLIFNHFHSYALELKSDFHKSKPKALQVLQASHYASNLIYLFADLHNIDFILNKIITNQWQILKHYSNKQIEYWKQYWKNKEIKQRKRDEATLSISKGSNQGSK